MRGIWNLGNTTLVKAFHFLALHVLSAERIVHLIGKFVFVIDSFTVITAYKTPCGQPENRQPEQMKIIWL